MAAVIPAQAGMMGFLVLHAVFIQAAFSFACAYEMPALTSSFAS